MANLKVQAWDEQDFSKHLKKRLAYAKEYRKNKHEEQWENNERVYYNASLQANGGTPSVSSEDLAAAQDEADFDAGVRDVAINYLFRDIRYMHAQMSANPPTVKIIPTSIDMKDEERAEAADLTARWAAEKYNFQEVTDGRNLKTLTKGTGHLRFVWDETLGRIVEFNEETGDLEMSGDAKLYSPSTWNIWLDPDAKTPDVHNVMGPKWFFELLRMDYEEALLLFPDHKDKLESNKNSVDTKSRFRFWQRSDQERQGGEDKIDIYAYVEKGLAVNGMKGRCAYMLEDGTILEHGANKNPSASLGLDVLTDIDVEDEPYGKSVIEYLDDVQAMIQTLDANTLRNVAAHASIRMYVNEKETELEDETVTDDSLHIIKGSGNAPTFLNPPSQMPDAYKLRDQLYQGSRDISMINEAMVGQTSRETSGYTFQSQINAGNMGRRRLFNKVTQSTKNLYYGMLSLFIQNWEDGREIQVLGQERAYEKETFDKTDIDGGWDIIASYGQNLSLDPSTARDQLMQLMPLFDKIEGFDYRSLVDAIRLNVMDNFIDPIALAKRKQRRIFRTMIKNHKQLGTVAYIAPRDLEKHKEMLDYCYEFVMTQEFELLGKDTQGLIERHIREREDMMAAQAAKAQAPQPGAAPAAAPATQPSATPAPALV